MNIKVKACTRRDGVMYVLASSKLGEFCARCGNALLERDVGREVDVELDIDIPIVMGENAFVEDELEHGFYDGEIVFTVEQQDEDGMVFARLARDAAAMIQAEGEIPVSTKLRMRVPEQYLQVM